MAANKKTTKNRLRKDQPPPEANGMPADASTPTRKTAASRKPKSTKAQKHAKANAFRRVRKKEREMFSRDLNGISMPPTRVSLARPSLL